MPQSYALLHEYAEGYPWAISLLRAATARAGGSRARLRRPAGPPEGRPARADMTGEPVGTGSGELRTSCAGPRKERRSRRAAASPGALPGSSGKSLGSADATRPGLMANTDTPVPSSSAATESTRHHRSLGSAVAGRRRRRRDPDAAAHDDHPPAPRSTMPPSTACGAAAGPLGRRASRLPPDRGHRSQIGPAAPNRPALATTTAASSPQEQDV